MMYKSLNDFALQCISDLFVRLSDFHKFKTRKTKIASCSTFRGAFHSRKSRTLLAKIL